MNIKEAKTEIKNALQAYHRRDAAGKYVYPISRQRPILLMGPPGIGKTAILEQVAREAGVGLVAYSLTHHTRQSAVGLPHIEHHTYEGRDLSVTEYTMSEIVASVYETMEKTGKQEGILFLDEVNCVSETLAPTMLQLLQYKTFGSHAVPEGWMIVTAGNPPAYNKSVREFDVATLDRVRTIPVEADCGVWLEYAAAHGVHGAILSYLAIKPDHFYLVEERAEGKYFVTARGWEDLSELLKSYEALGLPVTKALVRQFLQKEEVAGAFAAYYRLFKTYEGDYGIPALLDGTMEEQTRLQKREMARKAGFEERFTVVQLLMDGLERLCGDWELQHRRVKALHESLLQLKRLEDRTAGELAAERKKSLEVKLQAELLDSAAAETEAWVIERLEQYDTAVKADHHWEARDAFEAVKALFSGETAELDHRAAAAGEALDRAFAFAEDCFGEGQELVLLVTDLSRSQGAMAYVTAHGCEAFLRHADALLYRRQEQQLQAQCRALTE